MSGIPASRRSSLAGAQFVRQGAARFDLSDPYALAISLSWGGFALLFATLELLINVLFASLYWAQPDCVANIPPGSFLYAFFFSIETLATVGYGVMAPATSYGHLISAVEIISGTAFTAIMTGLTFVRFSRPRPRILYADHPVITRHNGQPTLMIRLANGRVGLMTDASVRLTVLLAERSKEGQAFRRTHDLQLERNHTPIFALTWTVMHVIGLNSPIHGMTLPDLVKAKVRLFVTFEARDVTLEVSVHDLHQYQAETIMPGMRFSDAVSFASDGTPMADLSRLSLLEPEHPSTEQEAVAEQEEPPAPV